MTEKLLEKNICQECSANVRPGALFCYNCGAPYESNVAVDTKEDVSPYKTGSLNRNGNKSKSENNNPSQFTGTAELPIGKPAEKPFADASAVAPSALIEKKAERKKTLVREESKSRNPSPQRAKSRVAESERVEIIWEEPENSTNLWFFTVSIILVLLAIGIVVAALYLK